MNELKEISFDEHKNIQLDILKEVASFCEEKGIRYYLSDGSLIGAIRHKGFIPWDDDIDIEMPRPDYNKFKKMFVNHKKLRFVAPGDLDSRYHHGKVIRTDTLKMEKGIKYNADYLGVDIDVFIVDGCPDDEEEYDRLRKKIFRLYNTYAQIKCGLIGSAKHKLKIMLMRAIYGPPKKIIDKAFELCERYSFDESKYIARYERFSLGFRVPADCYSDFEYKEFEGMKFRVPKGYDTILKAQYGDYMELPPENERITHHVNKVFWNIKGDE